MYLYIYIVLSCIWLDIREEESVHCNKTFLQYNCPSCLNDVVCMHDRTVSSAWMRDREHLLFYSTVEQQTNEFPGII